MQQEEMQAYGEEEPGVDEEGNEYQVQVEEQDEGEGEMDGGDVELTEEQLVELLQNADKLSPE